MTHRRCRVEASMGKTACFTECVRGPWMRFFANPVPGSTKCEIRATGQIWGFFGHSIAPRLTGSNMAGFIYAQKINCMPQSKKGGTEMDKRLQATIVRLPDDLHSEMRIAAIRRRTTLQKVMVEAVARWLQEIKEVNSEKEKTA